MTTNAITGRDAKNRAAAVLLADAAQYAHLATHDLKRMIAQRRAADRRASRLAAEIVTQQQTDAAAPVGVIAADLAPFMYLNESPEMRDLKHRHAVTVARLRNLAAGFYLIARGEPQTVLSAWCALKAEYYRRADYVRFIAPHDDANARLWVIAPSLPRPEYMPDATQYAALNRQTRYTDITPGQVLKLLFQEHKITKRDLKDALKRAENGKRQRGAIQAHITRYYQSMKAKTGKWGKSTLKRLTEPKRPFYHVSMENGSRYRVELKRRFVARIGEPLPVTNDAPHALALAQFCAMFGEDAHDARTATNRAIMRFIEEDIKRINEAHRAQKAATLTAYATEEFKTRLVNANRLSGIDDAPTPRRD